MLPNRELKTVYKLSKFQADMHFTETKLNLRYSKTIVLGHPAYLKVTFTEGKCVPRHLIEVLLEAVFVAVRADEDDFYALVVFLQLGV